MPDCLHWSPAGPFLTQSRQANLQKNVLASVKTKGIRYKEKRIKQERRRNMELWWCVFYVWKWPKNIGSEYEELQWNQRAPDLHFLRVMVSSDLVLSVTAAWSDGYDSSPRSQGYYSGNCILIEMAKLPFISVGTGVYLFSVLIW